MRIALVQQVAGPDKARNVERGLKAFETAAENGARLVGFAEPAFEAFSPPNTPDVATLARAEPVPGPITETFAASARRLGVVTVLNLFERDGEHTFDCSPVID